MLAEPQYPDNEESYLDYYWEQKGDWKADEKRDLLDDLFPHYTAWQSTPENTYLCLKDDISANCSMCGEITHWIYRHYHEPVCSIECTEDLLSDVKPSGNIIHHPKG